VNYKEGLKLDEVMAYFSRQCPSYHLEKFMEILSLQ
jgi:hypothetical protein